ncbi:MAG: ParB/RepB/Spo0J family partition protein [Flavobacteriales bacterium]
MAEKKRALGKGLSALLKNPETDITSLESNKDLIKVAGSISEIDINQIKVNPFQPRIDFDQDTLQELAASISQLGIIQPITVRKMGYDKYQLISGERRFRACQIAQLESVPAFVRIANDQEMLEMALVENIQREQLNPVEVALSYQRLLDECKLTQDKMSERVGKKRSTITNYLRLLKLPAEILASLKNKEISMGHARALINVSNHETQINIFRDTLENGFSVREIEQIVKEFGSIGYKKVSPKARKSTIPSFEHQKISNDLKKLTGKPVSLKVSKSGKGKLEISFSNDDELSEIIKYFGI